MARYVDVRSGFNRRGQDELEAVIKAHPAVQVIQKDMDPLGRGPQLVCRKEFMSPLDQLEVCDGHQDTLSLPPEQLTMLESSQR
jgi:hypothetical protein